MSYPKSISFIIPTFHQEKTILKDIKKLSKSLEQLGIKYEILIVADGLLSKVEKVVKKSTNKFVKVIGYEKNHGKGYAVKYGMLMAKGEVIGFIDAGLDLDPAEIPMMLDIMEWNKADIVVGSKLHPDSKVNYPPLRIILSWGYRALTHLLFGFKVRDSQVGLKLFRKKVAKDIFKRILVKRFAFDVETLAVAYSLGYDKIYEAPIKIKFRWNTINSFNFWRVIGWMLWDTAAVFYRLRILKYYDKSKID